MPLFPGIDSYSMNRAWVSSASLDPSTLVGPGFLFLYSLNPMLLKLLLSSLDSQFCFLLDFLKTDLHVNGLEIKEKMSWRDTASYVESHFPVVLLSPGFVSQTPVSLAATNTKSFIFSVQWNYCFLLRLYSSFPSFFPTSLHFPIAPPSSELSNILKRKHPRWMWNSFPCLSLLGTVAPEFLPVLTALQYLQMIVLGILPRLYGYFWWQG